jgi:Flp pilus assembly protein TadD
LRLSSDTWERACALCDTGMDLINNEQPRLAEAELRKALELCPTLAVAWFNLGIALHDQGKHPVARAAYGRAIMVAILAHNQPDTVTEDAKFNLSLLDADVN